jgi:hypothetical protein
MRLQSPTNRFQTIGHHVLRPARDHLPLPPNERPLASTSILRQMRP